MDSALIVTSSSVTAQALSQMLRQAGVGLVETVPTRARASELLSRRDFDLLVINSRCPGEDAGGLERNAIEHLRAENERLRRKIEDLRIIDRAKCLLISHMNISEKEAHRAIEKQAMDMRSTKRAIAEVILKTYEN